jgi:hypothetical protein
VQQHSDSSSHTGDNGSRGDTPSAGKRIHCCRDESCQKTLMMD